MHDTRPERHSGTPDLTVLAVPAYFAAMAIEHWWLARRARQQGPSTGDYERRDTLASLAMGVGSLVTPMLAPKILGPLTPGRGRFGKALVALGLGAVAATTVADAVVRRTDDASPSTAARSTAPIDGARQGASPVQPLVVYHRATHPSAVTSVARRLASVGGVVAVAAGAVATATLWAELTSPERLWRRRLLPPLGGLLGLGVATAGWDFLYYWDHRLMHESRYLWANHVMHHSSERYNYSTALRQPVADALTPSVPFGVLCLVGLTPEMVVTARSINLLYQFWIHTETIPRLGRSEAVLNTPSHHRVHHGSNSHYIDRNHGGILIVWDRLFSTFEPEREPVVYGLTTNIETFNPLRIATHEYADMLADVARSTTWRERLSFVVRGPGWAIERHRRADAAPSGGADGAMGYRPAARAG